MPQKQLKNYNNMITKLKRKNDRILLLSTKTSKIKDFSSNSNTSVIKVEKQFVTDDEHSC